MKQLKIEATRDTPEVFLDPANNDFIIKGISHPENIKKFFDPIFYWFDNYYEEVKDKKDTQLTLTLCYQYLNSASFKYLVELMKKLLDFHHKGLKVEIIWQYEDDDEDMKETGIELFELSDIDLPRKFVPITDE